ncbi:hypothetical protein CHS0354_009593 [Potamilus streckersoni]|uniref:Lipocalin/cytosolic fatty-acid binding domain-containing protein n=1 Tax=Potamilus streckersoni TaxID=2493646 RepID=A0AAE0SPF8_9BIVA|nr:hypothetical protein CHS0354_009593 [Potamilus streckersoni]
MFARSQLPTHAAGQRDPVDLKKCFSYTALTQTTNTPGKLRRTIYINATTSMLSDYWVRQTDYTVYAVVYGCREQNLLGQCTYPDSWVWSRTPQLNADQWAIVNTAIDSLCLQEAMFLATEQANGNYV